MSMLSRQCDRLTKTASDLRRHGTFAGFGGSVNRDPLAHDAAKEMEDAAETIRDLRDRCVELADENAMLRSCLSDDAENARLLLGEVDGLMELCSDMHEWMSRALYEGSARRYEYESMTERMDEIGVPHD